MIGWLLLPLWGCWTSDADLDKWEEAGQDEPFEVVTPTGDAGSPVDADNDGFASDVDCDDADAERHPDATEVCDGVDNNCDGQVDEDVTQVFYADADDDGFGNLDIVTAACAVPDGFVSNAHDCDDSDNTSYPSAEEMCDGVDNDCNDQIDEGVTNTFYADEDGDGFGDVNVAVEFCDAPSGYVSNDTDCDDNNNTIYPGASDTPENGIDEDCDGSDATLSENPHDMDDDSDGFSENQGDCDDANSAIYPGAESDDMIDGVDQNCDGVDGPDVDNDGYIDSAGGGNDCDDTDPAINPGASEIPNNGQDDDCDGIIDLGGTDADGDGYDSSVDCDDSNPNIHPGALDIGQDGIDQDCDGADELGLCSDNCSSAAWNGDGVCDDGGPNADHGTCGFGADCTDCGPRYDNDGDGYYDDEGVGGLSANLALDCDDSDVNINPGVLDLGQDGIDQDCDGADELGLCSDNCSSAGDGVCDDGGPNAVTLACSFGSDCSDCGPRDDDDGDGFYDDEGLIALDTALVLDCDDTDSSVYPSATEIENDGVDQDCDGSDLVAGVALCDNSCPQGSNGSCDDGGANSATSLCGLGTDCADCGDRYDSDSDGYDNILDCDDSDANVNPGVTADTCDGVDSDCDGIIDQDIDTLEPNDSANPYDMGDLDASGDAVSATSYMTHANDEDAFSLYLFDNYQPLSDTDNFNCEITPPAGLDVAVELLRDSLSLGIVDANGLGQVESFQYTATYLYDDEGTYTLVVTSTSGSSCSPISISCVKP